MGKQGAKGGGNNRKMGGEYYENLQKTKNTWARSLCEADMTAAALTCRRPMGDWDFLHSLPSMEEAKAFVKLCISDPTTGSQQPLPLRMKWQRSRSNGVTHVYYICASHKGCTYEVRIRQDYMGLFNVEELQPGQHISCPGLVRCNSITTPQEEALILMMSDCGAKPAAILGQLTVEYLKLCKRPGITAQKRPEGGLAGACCPQACDGLFSRVFLAFSLFSGISTCFLHVFLLFSSSFLAHFPNVFLYVFSLFLLSFHVFS